MIGLWRAFWRGFAGVMGVAPVLRYVETPEESMQAVAEQIRSATAEVNRRTDR